MNAKQSVQCLNSPLGEYVQPISCHHELGVLVCYTHTEWVPVLPANTHSFGLNCANLEKPTVYTLMHNFELVVCFLQVALNKPLLLVHLFPICVPH